MLSYEASGPFKTTRTIKSFVKPKFVETRIQTEIDCKHVVWSWLGTMKELDMLSGQDESYKSPAHVRTLQDPQIHSTPWFSIRTYLLTCCLTNNASYQPDELNKNNINFMYYDICVYKYINNTCIYIHTYPHVSTCMENSKPLSETARVFLLHRCRCWGRTCSIPFMWNSKMRKSYPSKIKHSISLFIFVLFCP